MPCRPVKSVYFDGFQNIDQVIDSLDLALSDLASIASDTDFSDDEESKLFVSNVDYIKNYFVKCERLVRG